jgi:hypothetical protein
LYRDFLAETVKHRKTTGRLFTGKKTAPLSGLSGKNTSISLKNMFTNSSVTYMNCFFVSWESSLNYKEYFRIF